MQHIENSLIDAAISLAAYLVLALLVAGVVVRAL